MCVSLSCLYLCARVYVCVCAVKEERAISLWRTKVDAMHVKLKQEEGSLEGLDRYFAVTFLVIYGRKALHVWLEWEEGS